MLTRSITRGLWRGGSAALISSLVFGALAACRSFTAPPTLSAKACTQDSQCSGTAICNAGQCDTTHCHVDAQCPATGLCLGSNDGGSPGSCAVNTCTPDGGCPASGQVCLLGGAGYACVAGCFSDGDCGSLETCVGPDGGLGACGGSCRTDGQCGTGQHCLVSDGGFRSCSSGCSADSQCGSSAICYLGSCNSSRCRTGSTCESGVCTLTDGGSSVGYCGVVECLPGVADAGCPLGTLCQTTSQGLECEPGCHSPSDCPAFETCGVYVNGLGLCGAGCKSTADCLSRSYPLGVCLTPSDGGYPYCGCTTDSDCVGCQTCYPSGFCAGAIDGGPVRQGDPAALAMTDNLASAMSYMSNVYPGSQLVSIFGYSLSDGGTANTTNPKDFTPGWQYEFAISATQQESLIYSAASPNCALLGQIGDLPAGSSPIAPATIPVLILPASLNSLFVTTYGCQGWQSLPRDNISYLPSGDGGATFDLTTAESGFMRGDAVTGNVYTHLCQ